MRGNWRETNWLLTAIAVMVALQVVLLWGISGRLGGTADGTANGVNGADSGMAGGEGGPGTAGGPPPQPPSVPEGGATATADGGDGEEGGSMAEWRVSGAGDSSYNGDYSEAGEVNGKAYYAKGATYLCWDGVEWTLTTQLGDVGAYIGTGDDLPANPWAVTVGTPPAPTVEEALPVPDTWLKLNPMMAQRYEPSADCCLAAIKAYVRSKSGSKPVRAALYGYEAPATYPLLALSAMGQMDDSAGWIELGFADYPVLEEGETYYLAVWAPWGAGEIARAASGSGAAFSVAPEMWPDWPDPGWLEYMAGALSIAAVLGDDVAGGQHGFSYSVGAPDAPVAGGRHGFAYSVGVQGRHAFSYSVGIGGRHPFSYSVGRCGRHPFAYSVGIGGRHRFAYSRGPWTPLDGRHRFSYSVGQGASGSHAFAYSVGEQVSGRHKFSFSVGEQASGSHKFAYSAGGPAAEDRFTALDLLRIRRGPVG